MCVVALAASLNAPLVRRSHGEAGLPRGCQELIDMSAKGLRACRVPVIAWWSQRSWTGPSAMSGDRANELAGELFLAP
jgi:hypothetical protein